ncbi:MAG: BrnT family toxin [Lachnospiraceae bacterium]|jgi:uncharacterized DUF497 family protein|nr:BrnT family toxin [Lachnospiraceae bacterium]
MQEIRFIWDENKNELNKKKHGISFEEAKDVFGDENAILFDDPDHSYEEERFLIIGMTGGKGICIVSHCYKDEDSTIRIISAREATKSEKKTYQKGW